MRAASLRLSVLLIGLVLSMTNCGMPGPMLVGNTPRLRLQSIRLAPAPNPCCTQGQLFFTAVGDFSDGSTASTSQAGANHLDAQWYVGAPPWLSPLSPTVVTITDGLAKCNGFVGATSIVAVAAADPSSPVNSSNGANAVVGTAPFSCP